MNNTPEESFSKFSFGTQVRKSPFSDAALRWGAKGFSVYNHMYIPRDFGDPVKNFWNLVNHAILCDVAVERQVEITGPDAASFTQYLTCRDISACEVGQCKYVFLTDDQGGVINDPILLKLAEDRFWLSIADSDVLLWAKGVAIHAKMEVKICEPDVSPLQLQGPRSRDILRAAFGDAPAELKYYRFMKYDWDGVPLIISRTGWSSELGYEIFLCDGSKGGALWEYIMEAGKPFGLMPGHTSSIRRIEAAMLSYNADVTLDDNPYEFSMERLVNCDGDFDFIGKKSLQDIRSKGVSRKFVGLEIFGDPIVGSNSERWAVYVNGNRAGYVTSAIYSPRLKKNIALAMVSEKTSAVGSQLEVDDGILSRKCVVVPKPFYDPQKTLVANG